MKKFYSLKSLTLTILMFGFFVMNAVTGLSNTRDYASHETFNTLTTLNGNGGYNADELTQVGSTGNMWRWLHCQDGAKQSTPYIIDGVTPVLRHPTAYMEATITGGISEFSLDYKRAYTSASPNRIVQVYINDILIASGENCKDDDILRTLEKSDLTISGTFTIRIKIQGTGTSNAQTCIDNFKWSPYEGAPQVATPAISPNGGIFYAPVTATITCSTADATIRYTTDGNNPTATSTEYTAPISIPATATLKAIAIKAGMTNSEIATAAFTITAPPSVPSVVISGVYGGGGNNGAPYKNDYIELYNTTNAPINLEGYSLYYASATGTNASAANTYTFLAGATIGAHKFALVKAAAGATVLTEWPVLFDFDASGTSGENLGLSGTNGKVLLLSAYANLSATNSIPTTLSGIQAMANYVDYVPYGNATPVFGTNIPTLANATAATRKYNDATQVMQYTFDVGADFDVVTVAATTPRNSLYGLSVAAPTFTPPAGYYSSTQSVAITSATEGAVIYYSTDGSEPSLLYSTPISVSTTTTIKAMATKTGLPNSTVVTAVYNFPIEVTTIADFKAANSATSTVVYKITNPVTFVYRSGRNIYVKDATGGLLIFDNTTPVITNSYNNGDVISGGVTGTCTLYNGLYEMIPVANLAAGTPGTAVQPITLTMANLLANFANYESQLVKLETVTFDAGTFGTSSAGGNINIHQNTDQMICRNQYNNITGYEPNPAKFYNVSGFAIPYNADRQIAPRELSDIVELVSYTVSVEALPTAGGSVTGGGTYLQGENATITATANTGYNFINWTEGATNITTNPYTFSVTANRAFVANFQIKTYNITSSVNGSNGTISPLGTTSVNHGSSQTYTITPNSGYQISQVLVDGTNNTTAVTSGSYTFSNVTATHTIVAYFTAKQYTLTLDPSTGTCTATSIPVTYASTIVAAYPSGIPNATQSGCTFLGWFIGADQITNTTVWNYTENKTAKAVFNYPIVATNLNPTLGTITNLGSTNYSLGQSATYTCTPNAGYHIATVVVDGSTVFTGNNETTAPYTHTFSNIGAAHTIQVSFAQNCYAMNPGNTIGTGTTVTMSQTGCVPHGANVTFTFTANCADITGVTVGGTPVPPPFAPYTLPAPVTGPLPVIVVNTIPLQYTITATPAEGVDPMGYIEPSGVTTVACGETITYNFITELGYRVKNLLVDGDPVIPVPASKSYTFTNINASHTIAIEFEEFPYCIIAFGPSAAQNQHGIVYPNLAPNAEYYVAVDSGTLVYPFTIQPDPGYVIDKVYVDNTLISSAVLTGTYTFTHIVTNHEIFATFKPIMYTITATADANGFITPSGAVQVAYNTNQTFNATPKAGYDLDKILVDGVEDATASVDGFYTFENVMQNHTIHATFMQKSYKITTTAVPTGTGTITPMNPMVPHGNNQTFYFNPTIGYVVDQILVDGIAAPVANSYTFVNVIEEHTLQVTFAKAKFTVTATHQGGGENSFITPYGVTLVEYDAHSPVYVFVSAEGYHVQTVLVDNINNPLAVEEGMYRFLNVKANHTIHVIFAKDNFTITATANPGGFISPAGTAIVPNGSNKTYFFHASLGYQLVRVLINGINNEGAVALSTYTFENVSDDHTIEAQFEKKLYNVIYEEVLGAIVVPVDGSVSPVEYGGKYKFKVELQEGYTQSNLIIRANNLIINPSGNVYAINNIAADQYITISGVALNQYKITAKAYNGGTISPAGTFMVEHGDNMTFTMTANANYKISNVLVNGESMGAVSSYLFNDLRSDSKIEAYFELNNVGINENEATINVFSHQNIVTIINENLVPVKQVEIMDMFGRVVWTGQTTDVKTEITLDVAKGVYAVRIITSDNNPITNKVIIN